MRVDHYDTLDNTEAQQSGALTGSSCPGQTTLQHNLSTQGHSGSGGNSANLAEVLSPDTKKGAGTWEIDFSQLRFEAEIGEGAFGVCLCESLLSLITHPTPSLSVCIQGTLARF